VETDEDGWIRGTLRLCVVHLQVEHPLPSHIPSATSLPPGQKELAQIWMHHGLRRRHPLCMIINKQFVQEIDRFVRDVALVVSRHESGPGCAGVGADHDCVVRVEADFVLSASCQWMRLDGSGNALCQGTGRVLRCRGPLRSSLAGRSCRVRGKEGPCGGSRYRRQFAESTDDRWDVPSIQRYNQRSKLRFETCQR
jgi:hypothetical protein